MTTSERLGYEVGYDAAGNVTVLDLDNGPAPAADAPEAAQRLVELLRVDQRDVPVVLTAHHQRRRRDLLDLEVG